ncbi:MAG: hypothetical protein M1824_005537 [Vezdaea acicularis]|nr:MAG: hypothetical protein M1824_005537 [Vezdaea acicularis]
MFRRCEYPADPVYPHDLKSLGYFIDANDQIKSISAPDEGVIYYLNRNERYNDVFREAMNSCVRKIAIERLHELGLETVRLPLGTNATHPHVPILASKNLLSKDRVVILIDDNKADLAVLSYGVAGQNGCTINFGTCVDLVKAASTREPHNAPGMVIANLSQLLWWRGGAKAVSHRTWHNLPKESVVHPSMAVDMKKNRIERNDSEEAHVQCLFEDVVGMMVNKNAKIDIIGVSDGASIVVKYLNAHWAQYKSRVDAICVCDPTYQISDLTTRSFAHFMQHRSRSYIVVPSLPPATLISVDNMQYAGPPTGSPTYSCQVPSERLILSSAYPVILQFFEDVRDGYGNPESICYGGVTLPEKDDDTAENSTFKKLPKSSVVLHGEDGKVWRP